MKQDISKVLQHVLTVWEKCFPSNSLKCLYLLLLTVPVSQRSTASEGFISIQFTWMNESCWLYHSVCDVCKDSESWEVSEGECWKVAGNQMTYFCTLTSIWNTAHGLVLSMYLCSGSVVLTVSFTITPNKFSYVIIFMHTNFIFFPLCVLEISLHDKCRAIRTGYETGTPGVSVSRTQM